MKVCKGIIRRLFALVLAFCLCINSFMSIIVFARMGEKPTSIDETAAKDAAKEDWRTYTQTDIRWGALKMNPGSKIIYDYGCFVTSQAALMKATGLMPADWSPLDYFQWLSANGGWNGYSEFCINITSYPDCPFSGEQRLGVTLTDDEVKELLDEGCYILVHVNDKYASASSHYVPIVGYDSNGILFAETWDGYDRYAEGIDPNTGLGRKYRKLYLRKEDDANINGGTVEPYAKNAYNVYICPESKFDNAKSIEGTLGGTSSSATPMTDTEVASIVGWLDEKDFLSTGQMIETNITVPQFTAMSAQDKIEVRGWKQDIDNKNAPKAISFMRALVIFIGILMTVYGVLLYVAYHFDVVNNVVDISLLSVLSLGRLIAASGADGAELKGTESARGARAVKHGEIIKITLIAVTIGVLMITGGIYKVILWAIRAVQTIMKK